MARLSYFYEYFCAEQIPCVATTMVRNKNRTHMQNELSAAKKSVKSAKSVRDYPFCER